MGKGSAANAIAFTRAVPPRGLASLRCLPLWEVWSAGTRSRAATKINYMTPDRVPFGVFCRANSVSLRG